LKGLSFNSDVQPFEVVKLTRKKAIKTGGDESVYELCRPTSWLYTLWTGLKPATVCFWREEKEEKYSVVTIIKFAG
jgi:hypothetical protein